MLQGAFDYTMNLAGELWTMIWKPTEEPRMAPVKEVKAQSEGKSEERCKRVRLCRSQGTASDFLRLTAPREEDEGAYE
jgi:hypothetical protein